MRVNYLIKYCVTIFSIINCDANPTNFNDWVHHLQLHKPNLFAIAHQSDHNISYERLCKTTDITAWIIAAAAICYQLHHFNSQSSYLLTSSLYAGTAITSFTLNSLVMIAKIYCIKTMIRILLWCGKDTVFSSKQTRKN